MNNQRLVLRIETLQNKDKPQLEAASAGGGWGSSLFGNSTAGLTQELTKAKQDLEVAQEELEAKMAENCKLRNLHNSEKTDLDVDTYFVVIQSMCTS